MNRLTKRKLTTAGQMNRTQAFIVLSQMLSVILPNNKHDDDDDYTITLVSVLH